MINDIQLSNFRCFKEQEITFTPGINLLIGENGSGKTSIIEALYLLGRGRSFRTNYLSDLTLHNSESSIIRLSGSRNETSFRIGCEIKKSKLTIKINHSVIPKRSLLLDYLPLQIITPSSHELIESGPSNRRKFIDWGLFHVEHPYRKNWSLFRRVLKQRNQLLKEHSNDVQAWDDQFTKYALILDGFRKSYFNELEPIFLKVQQALLGNTFASINFYSGWDNNIALDMQLKYCLKKDMSYGWTSVGPQKADMKFIFSQSTRNVLSRGQQKMLVFALQIAQCLHLQQVKHYEPLLLIDDISSELDKQHLSNLLALLQETQLQCIVNAIDDSKVDATRISGLFHVEH